MALSAHYIRAEYDVQLQLSNDDPPDPWQTESSSAGFDISRRLVNAPKFVPALLSYDEWGSAAAPTTLTPSDPPHGDVASWYRSLSRQGPSSATQPEPPSPSGSAATRHRTSETTLEPSSSSSSPSIATLAPSSRSIHATGTLSSLSSSAARLASGRQHRRGHDWFISRAISQSQAQSASAPLSPRPNTSSSNSLADILSRYDPSTTQPFRPPVFLHLGPSNKGWIMLQNQGWSEGEGLGAGSNNSLGSDAKQTLHAKKEKRERPDPLSPPAPPTLPTSPSRERATNGEREGEEIFVDDDDPIFEVRKKAHVPTMIDLTLSDTEDEDDDGDDNSSDTADENNDDVNYSPTPAPAPPDPTSASDHDPRAAQTILLTPLTTVLKSDRLGIGLKAKTEGPYRSSVKRVKRNAATAAAEDAHRARRLSLLGKGHRAFARAERLERESRQSMMAYLSEP